MEVVLEGMAEYYSVQLATNVKRGMDNVARKGAECVGGTLPVGVSDGTGQASGPDPKTAPLVRRIFEMYVAGNTQKEIIEHLNAEGLRTRKGSR